MTTKAEDEIGPLFAQHGLPAPRLVMQAHSGLTCMMALATSDLLMMLPEMWTRFPMWSSIFQAIDIAELLPPRPICIVQRTGLPLTPAGEYFSDMFRRAAGYIAA